MTRFGVRIPRGARFFSSRQCQDGLWGSTGHIIIYNITCRIIKHSVNEAVIHCQPVVTEVGIQVVIVSESVSHVEGRHYCRTSTGTALMQLIVSRSLRPVAYRSSGLFLNING